MAERAAGTRIEWCDVHCWAAHDDDGYCIDCGGRDTVIECDRCGQTPAIVQTFCPTCGSVPLCGDCTTTHVVELEMEGPSVSGRAGHRTVRQVVHDHLFTILLCVELIVGLVVIAVVNGVR